MKKINFYVNGNLCEDIEKCTEPILRLGIVSNELVEVENFDLSFLNLDDLEELFVECIQIYDCNFLTFLPSVKFIFFNKCDIVAIPSEVSYMYNLEVIDVSNNSIASLNNINWAGLCNLKKINLSSNKIKNINDAFLLGDQLKYLSISNNPLNCISMKVESNFLQLETLDISSTLLSELPVEIGKFRNLKFIHLSDTFMDNFPLVILELSNLEYIYWEQYRIKNKEIHDDKKMKLLFVKALYLEFSTLVELPCWVRYFPNILELQMSYSHLQELPNWLADFEYLKYVYIEGTPLADIYEQIQPTFNKKIKWKTVF